MYAGGSKSHWKLILILCLTIPGILILAGLAVYFFAYKKQNCFALTYRYTPPMDPAPAAQYVYVVPQQVRSVHL